MRIYIVRHGDKAEGAYFNPILRQRDQPLSEPGEARAARLCAYFEPIDVSAIYTSEYLRAKQTARYVAEQKGLVPIVDRRLNEIDAGLVDGLSEAQMREQYPEFYADFFSCTKDVRCPGGENGAEVHARQQSLLADIIQNGRDVLLFSHEGYIRLLACLVLGLPPYRRNRFWIDFCGITEMEYRPERDDWRIIRVNHTVSDAD